MPISTSDAFIFAHISIDTPTPPFHSLKMRPKHLTSASRALYNVFVLPSLSQSSATPMRMQQPQQRPTPSKHSFSTTPLRWAKTRAPEVRSEKWDEEIKSRTIYIVDPTTNRLSEQPMTRYDVLSRIDRTTHRLIQVGEAPAPATASTSSNYDPFGDLSRPAAPAATIPVCKIQSKRDIYLEQARKTAEAKEKKRLSAITSSVKTLELNWAIDANDLGHRLERMREFLEEGRKVEVVLAAKKKGRKASTQECEGVLRRIRAVVDEVDGSREDKAMTGSLGTFTTLAFVGRPVKVGKGKG